MHKGRLEAFSDAVIAIIMTVMVLELKAPKGTSLEGLEAAIPDLSLYLLSFVFLAIYWNNHHHMLQVAKHVNGAVLWANMHLLFWLSLIPFVTAWTGKNQFRPWPVALYGTVLLLAGFAYMILARALVAHHGQDSLVAKAIGLDVKGILSLVIYGAAIPLSFVSSWLAFALYIFVALMWLIPDSRIENVLKE